VIELHAWRSAEGCTLAAFVYEKTAERLLRHFIGADAGDAATRGVALINGVSFTQGEKIPLSIVVPPVFSRGNP
jgi:hypothetical protein